MAESGASPSHSGALEKNDTALEKSPSEPMDTDAKATGTDTGMSAASNAGQNEVAVVTSLRDAANMGAKDDGMIVDENHCSEAVTQSLASAPTEPQVSKGLKEPKTELLQRVQALKKDLENWRGKLDTQVKSYREELGDLRTSLNAEVEQLRVEFQELRNTLKQQREVTSTKLAKLDEASETGVKSNLPLPTATATAHDTEQ